MVIKNTKEQGLYHNEHWGMDSFSYKLPNGKYVVKLHFAETSLSEAITTNGTNAKGFIRWRTPKGPKPGSPPEKTYGTMTEPLFDYNHSMGKCIIGGHVYRGKEVPELYGAYIFADHITGRVHALWYDDKAGKVTSVQPIDPPAAPASGGFTRGANGPSIFSFGEDEPGELYFTNTQGSVMHFRSTVDKQAKQ